MIWESSPWKRDLTKRVERLRRRRQQRRWSEASLAMVEQDVFQCAYAVRKLVEAGKVSDEVESRLLPAIAHSPLGHAVDVVNWHKIDELYDLTQSRNVDVRLPEFCNQLIHSFIFLLIHAVGGGLDGFYVASDRRKDNELLHFGIDTVCDTLMRVAQDEIVFAEISRQEEGKPRTIRKKSNRSRADG